VTSIEPRATPPSYSVRAHKGFGDRRVEIEHQLADCPLPLPFPERADWQRIRNASSSVLLVAHDDRGTPSSALSAVVNTSRALPGHHSYRVEKWGGSPSAGADDELLGELVRVAREDGFCLRVTVELFELRTEARERLGRRLAALGFSRSTRPRMYERTIAVDLQSTEAELFATLGRNTRRNVLAPTKKGLQLRTVEDLAFGPRIASLVAEAFSRTGVTPEPLPWAKIIQLSRTIPRQSRIIGLFDPKTSGPDGLVAFAWGCAHGSYATYEAGACTRRPEFGNLALSYAPVWDLIVWARNVAGAEWFDLGGVPKSDVVHELAGVPEFKRHFSDRVVDVSEEWILEPHRRKAALARAVRRAASWALRLSRR
jgi:hypothetical protein